VVSKPKSQKKRTPPEEQPPKLINFGGCSSGGVLFLQVGNHITKNSAKGEVSSPRVRSVYKI